MSGVTSEKFLEDMAKVDIGAVPSIFKHLVHAYTERVFWSGQGKITDGVLERALAKSAYANLRRADQSSGYSPDVRGQIKKGLRWLEKNYTFGLFESKPAMA